MYQPSSCVYIHHTGFSSNCNVRMSLYRLFSFVSDKIIACSHVQLTSIYPCFCLSCTLTHTSTYLYPTDILRHAHPAFCQSGWQATPASVAFRCLGPHAAANDSRGALLCSHSGTSKVTFSMIVCAVHLSWCGCGCACRCRCLYVCIRVGSFDRLANKVPEQFVIVRIVQTVRSN